MKKNKYLLILVFLLPLVSCGGNGSEDEEEKTEPSSFSVCSFNIRYSNSSPDTGSKNWSVRKDWIVDFINSYDIDVIGMQEEKNDQTADLKALLADGYKTIGIASSTKPGYEYNGIYYKTSTIELLDSGRFWLSETPDVESVGWDAKYHRQVTWCKFKERGSGKEFFFFNTHFSHIGEQAKLNSATLLLNKIRSIAKGKPLFATGDFNVWPDSETYGILTGSTDPTKKLIDSRKLVTSPLGPNYSGHCFGTCVEDGKIVDFVFVNDKIAVKKHEIVNKQPSASSYLSDHYPIYSEIAIK